MDKWLRFVMGSNGDAPLNARLVLVVLGFLGLAGCAQSGDIPHAPKAGVAFHLGSLDRTSGWGPAMMPSSTTQIYVDPNIVVGSRDIESVRDDGCHDGRCAVDFVFTPEGGRRMLRVTQQNIGRPMAIVVDGKVIVFSIISSEIRVRLQQSTSSAEESRLMLKQLTITE
jgi:hypothetical protein